MCSLIAWLSRLVLIVANFALALFGILLLSIGIFWTLRYDYYMDAVPSEYTNIQLVPILAVAVGSLSFLIAFQGCLGAYKRITWLLLSYSGILFVIFLLHIGFGIYGLMRLSGDDLDETVDNQMTKLFLKYEQNKGDAQTVDLIQQKLQCCGITSPSWWTSHGFSSIPNSCYSRGSRKLFEEGCSEAMLALIRSSITTISILMFIGAVMQASGAILALLLSYHIKASARTEHPLE